MSESSVTFTKEQIAAYAEASGDHNPIHLDDDFARTVGLPGVMTVAAQAAGGPDRLRRLYCRFAGMVVPGDTVNFTAQPAGEGRLQLRAVNEREEPVLTKSVAEYSS